MSENSILDSATEELLWPRYAGPEDLPAIEAIPLAARGLPESTYALLCCAATLWSDRTAVTVLPEAARWREPLRRSYSELLAEVHRHANLLLELGVRRTDAVALLAPNCAELIPATLAAQLAGIAAPINGGLSNDHVAELIRRSGARVVIAAGTELAPDIWKAACELARRGLVDALLVLRPTAAPEPPPELPAIDGVRVGYLDTHAAEQDSRRFDGRPPAASDLAALFHTGGTGVPKLAAHRHSGEVANAWMIAANSLLDEESAIFAALPLFHVNALVVTLLAPLFRGQPVVWVDADISSLRCAMVGASPLPPAVRESSQLHTGVALGEGYGLTEATCATARSFPEIPRPGTVGQRMPYQRVAVVETAEDASWTRLPVGETGVLIINGPTVFTGYVIGHDEHGHRVDGLGTLVDGWLSTGDLARIDDEGFIHLRGRAKDLIIRGGHNIDPATIEDVLLSHPSVGAAGAVGRPDVHAGEVPVAYVALVAGANATADELPAWASARVPERAAAPRTVTILDALPVTDVGKPYKLGLRADATRRELLDALAGVAGIAAPVRDGAIVATVTLLPSADRSAVEAVLDRYAIGSKVEVRQ